MFDADWQRNGHIERVVRDAASWVESRRIAGLKLGDPPRRPHAGDLRGAGHPRGQHRHHLPVRPPRQTARVQRLAQDLRPWTPNYGTPALAAAALTTAMRSRLHHRHRGARPAGHRAAALRRPDRRPAKGGSFDLPPRPAPAAGRVALVVPGQRSGSYDQLWLTTSLRATSPARSRWRSSPGHPLRRFRRPGAFRASASCARCSTGWRTRRPASCCRGLVPLRRSPPSRGRAPRPRSSATRVWKRLPGPPAPTATPALPTTTDPTQALINRTWKPTLSVTGAEGFPELKNAGNVLRPHGLQALAAPAAAGGRQPRRRRTARLEDNAPYNAKVTFHADGRVGAQGASGWNAPTLAPWMERALHAASSTHFGAPAASSARAAPSR